MRDKWVSNMVMTYAMNAYLDKRYDREYRWIQMLSGKKLS